MRFLMVMIALYSGNPDPVVVVYPKISSEQECISDGQKLKLEILTPQAGAQLVNAAFNCQPISNEQIDRMIDETHGPTGWMLVSFYKLNNPDGFSSFAMPRILSAEDCQSYKAAQNGLLGKSFGDSKQVIGQIQSRCQRLTESDVRQLLFSTVE
jgi:hypothetical protein